MTDYAIIHKKNSDQDRRKSAFLTLLISALVFLTIFFYQFTQTIEKPEVVTTMLINFGNNQQGLQTEEPQNQDGSPAAEIVPVPVEEAPKAVAEPIKVETPKPVAKEKLITGNNTKATVSKAEPAKKSSAKKSEAVTTKTSEKKAATAKNSTPATTSKTGTGDGKGTAAIGNLIKGRGTKPSSQGSGTETTGNAGDPLGGDSNGDSKIGVDRKLIGFIPGTMGRGGGQPTHNCTASGTINIAYTVDKSGNVTTARRLSGISDPCAVKTTVAWVKQYVKAEKANTQSTGTYKITF